MIKRIIYTDRSNSLLNAYLKDISKYKILSYEEVGKLVTEAQKGDMRARDKVVHSNLRFVVTIAKQFQNRGIPLMDLISSGNEGLLKAIEKFDPERGVVFLSYAVWWIKQAIYNSIYWQGREIRLPMSQQMLVIEILDATSKFLQKHQRNPSSVELAEITNIPVEQIDFLAQYSNKLVSVDDFIGGDEENNQVCDIIPDSTPPLEDVLNKDYISSEIDYMLSRLTIREHDIIRMLFGIGIPAVNSKLVSKMFGLSGERVRQIKESALSKLKRRFSNRLKNLL